jgi:hypothetical protein
MIRGKTQRMREGFNGRVAQASRHLDSANDREFGSCLFPDQRASVASLVYSQQLAFFGNPGHCTRTTQKRSADGACITQRKNFL